MTRDRGTYGPLDRDQNIVIGWGVDQAVDYARDRTIGAALRPVLPAVDIASRASRAADLWWTGSRGLGGRDEAGKPLTQVGQEFFHSVPDRTRAIAALATYFRVFVDDLATWSLANVGKPNSSTVAQWIAADVTPTREEFRTFVVRQDDSWFTKVATSWDTYEDFFDRLRTLRSLARAHGILLQSSEPIPLPKTIWQRGEEGNGTKATAMLGVLKIGVFAALSITGAVTMFTIIRDLHRRTDAKSAPSTTSKFLT